MKRILSTICVALSIGFGANGASADASDELSRLLQPLGSISGNFRQTLKDQKGKTLQKSSGNFSVERPGKLRWQTGEPFPQLLVTDNKKLWLYDPDLEQVTIRPVDNRMKETPALLLGGKVEDIRGSFSVENKKGAYYLTPKRASAPFKSMVIRFDGKGLPSAMTVRDGMGQTTDIQFNGLKANPKLSNSIFRFKPPKGTDIIRDE
ncbi:outer membrane lipoprotein chaperone LolA [Microbulbifer sp. CAU 1566]|uniref:outer membrane lipoprotein chaperone LolA n=1 Tax=unclassified Microbulbifer TaxID=2619833 RepID=UPI00135756E0|nr:MULTISPECIES: outer membrane lipoprotein chaperone LolA [unclassified Microbulbifer]MCK7596832.1 outer membrane lipoprotein chaperone LolA [Microbulbifer sp. CAU 1566]